MYKPKRKVKIGLDIHNCIDQDPNFFGELSRTLISLGHEVHITTGSFINDKLKDELVGYGMEWTHLWSISDYYKNKPGIELWYDEKVDRGLMKICGTWLKEIMQKKNNWIYVLMILNYIKSIFQHL